MFGVLPLVYQKTAAFHEHYGFN